MNGIRCESRGTPELRGQIVWFFPCGLNGSAVRAVVAWDDGEITDESIANLRVERQAEGAAD